LLALFEIFYRLAFATTGLATPNCGLESDAHKLARRGLHRHFGGMKVS